VLLFEAHRARLGPAAAVAFDAFAAAAAPGVYRVEAEGAAVRATPREGSRLYEGIPLRWVPSPLPAGLGPLPKAPSPGPYDAVRAPGLATLLTDPAGEEVWESCTAAVLAWDGAGLVASPADRSRVASTAEAVVARALPLRRAPLLRAAGWPVLLVNAVVGCCAPAGPAFPPAARRQVEAALLATARRP
jgi:hypothetical protein